MTWEEKTKMITYFNKGETASAIDVFIDNLDEVDDQGWDMFITAIELGEAELLRNLEKHKIIYKKMKEQQTDSWVTATRMAYYEILIEKLIEINP